jgi:hypothetical protein
MNGKALGDGENVFGNPKFYTRIENKPFKVGSRLS